MTDVPPVRILWVDDQGDFVNGHRHLLDGILRELRTADTGESALESLRDFSPDVILADLQMPPGEWGGLWLLEHLPRAITSDVPVIIVSGQGSMSECIQALRLGAADYVEKEQLDGELVARIQKAVQRFRETKPLSDYGRVRDLERTIHQKVVAVIHGIAAASEEPDPFRSGIVPRSIAMKTYERMFDDQGKHQEDYLDLLDLATLIDTHWTNGAFAPLNGILRPPNRQARTKWLQELNEARRVVAHPMRGQLSDGQSAAVARAEAIVREWLDV